MSPHHPFDGKYWNLAQAAAWVEYRENQLVEDFDTADRDAYMAVGMYPTMWPAGREWHGSVEELRRALEEARLASWGFRADAPDTLQEVPALEWADFVIRPPLVAFIGQLSNFPWHNVRVLSEEMKKLWRSLNEVNGRSKYDWAVIRTMYDEVRALNPKMTMNELIIEAQGAFEERFKKGAPSRTSFQNKIKTWS